LKGIEQWQDFREWYVYYRRGGWLFSLQGNGSHGEVEEAMDVGESKTFKGSRRPQTRAFC
jgi:hypothetical protein